MTSPTSLPILFGSMSTAATSLTQGLVSRRRAISAPMGPIPYCATLTGCTFMAGGVLCRGRRAPPRGNSPPQRHRDCDKKKTSVPLCLCGEGSSKKSRLLLLLLDEIRDADAGEPVAAAGRELELVEKRHADARQVVAARRRQLGRVAA